VVKIDKFVVVPSSVELFAGPRGGSLKGGLSERRMRVLKAGWTRVANLTPLEVALAVWGVYSPDGLRISWLDSL
jgi:hypothetical protein